MRTTSQLYIRPLRSGEQDTVRSIMRRSFPWVEQLFFSFSPNTLVAELDGRPVGAIVLKEVGSGPDRRSAFISWYFVEPEERGQGIGHRLVEAAIAWGQERGCDGVLACVEGFNTRSSNVFADLGFRILSFSDQVRCYGWHLPAMWIAMFHFMDLGHMVWARPGPAERSGLGGWEWLGAVAANILVFCLAIWADGGSSAAGYLQAAAAVVIILGLRQAMMLGVARAQRLSVRYRAWESGFPLGAALALVHVFLPLPGGLYPKEARWRYDQALAILGRMALASNAALLVMLWGSWALLRSPSLPVALAPWLEAVAAYGLALGIFDIALPFFPFQVYNGRRLWDWKPWLWALMVAAFVPLLLV